MDKNLETEKNLDRFQRVEIVQNHKELGKKCRSDLPKVLAELANSDSENLLSDIEKGSANLAGYDIQMSDISLRRVEKEGFAASTFTVDESEDISLVLDMTINKKLLSKGMAREITRRIQSKRKDLDLDVEATIKLSVWLSDGCPKLDDSDWEYVKSETRSEPAVLMYGNSPLNVESFEIDGKTIYFKVD